MNILSVSRLLPGTPRTFKAKTPITYQGEAPRCGFFITDGVVKAYTLQANGEEQIAGFFGPGDFFPMPWLFEYSSTAVYYYEALEPTKAVSVTRKDVREIIKQNKELTNYVFDKLIRDNTASTLRITALEQSRAVEKILFTLYYLLYQFGKPLKNNQYLIDIKLTHATIASLVGLTRETTATELNKLKRKGVLTYEKKLYQVNKDKLERAMGEDGFSELLEKQQ